MAESSPKVVVPRAGAVIADKYRLVAPVAEGGMGVVWRAEDLHLRAPVAVKLLHPRLREDAATRARFEAEAAIGAQLRSPHVVQILEQGVDRTSDLPFIAMELLEGESLQERLARAGPLSPRELLRVVSQVARALERAHAQGIIHRDLKPANIFLVRDGETRLAKVLDFGIAKRFSGAERAHTQSGALLGTPAYMSPEQLTGGTAVDPRSDLWSLGVIAVECATGKLPFGGEHLGELALAICHGRHRLPSALGPVPDGLDAWFQRACAPSPQARFQSAAELVEALREVCGQPGEPGEAVGPAPAARESAPHEHTAGASPERTILLPHPELRRRGQSKLLWGALATGALLIWLALRVRLPEPAPPSTEALRSTTLSNAPRPAAAPQPAAPQPAAPQPTAPSIGPAAAAPEASLAPALAETAPRSAPLPSRAVQRPRSEPRPTAEAAPVTPRAVPPPSTPPPSTPPPSTPRAASEATAAPPTPPALDPDNLGF